jgi:hypothetical protein
MYCLCHRQHFTHVLIGSVQHDLLHFWHRWVGDLESIWNLLGDYYSHDCSSDCHLANLVMEAGSKVCWILVLGYGQTTAETDKGKSLECLTERGGSICVH